LRPGARDLAVDGASDGDAGDGPPRVYALADHDEGFPLQPDHLGRRVPAERMEIGAVGRDELSARLLSFDVGLEMVEVGGAHAVPERANDDVAIVDYGLAGGGMRHREFQRFFRLGFRTDGEGLDRNGWPVVEIDSVFEGQGSMLLLEGLRVVVVLRFASS